MKNEIVRLSISDFEKCGNIWDMQKQSDLAERFLREMREGIRTAYVYKIDGEYIGEVSIVTDTGDEDYTIPGRRLYLSRLIVKDGYRRQGIGRKLVEHVIRKAEDAGYTEISVGVDADNFPALKLYVHIGFDKIVFVGEDEYGRFLKLLRRSE